MSQSQKLWAKVLAVPVEMRFSEVKQVLEDAGWIHGRTVGSHHQFTKPGKRTLVVPEHGGKVKQATIRQVAQNIETGGGTGEHRRRPQEGTTMNALDELLARPYPFRAVVEPTGGWSIVFPDLPGCTSYAADWDEIGPQARTALVMWLESEYEQGHPIPAPTVGDDAPGFGDEAFTVPVSVGTETETTMPHVTGWVGSRRNR